MEKKERNSGIELLKIFAVIIIIFSHSMPSVLGEETEYVMNLSLATDSIQRIMIVLFKYGGQLGNDIFIISSAWFLLESNKMNIKKVFYMIGDCFTVSIVFLFIFLICGYEIGVKEMVKQFMPTYMTANWFIGCYLLFYMIHPILNLIIDQLTKKYLLILDTTMFFIYGGLQFLRRNAMFYSYLIGFICIYFIMAYVKKYLKKNNSFSHNEQKSTVAVCYWKFSFDRDNRCTRITISAFFDAIDKMVSIYESVYNYDSAYIVFISREEKFC